MHRRQRYYYNHIYNEINYLKNYVEDLKRQITEHANKNFNIDKELTDFRYKLGRFEERLDVISKEINNLVHEYKKSESRTTEAIIKIESVLDDIRKLSDSLGYLNNIVTELQEKTISWSPIKQQEIERKIEILNTTLNELQIKLNLIETMYFESKRKLENIEKKIDDMVGITKNTVMFSEEVKNYFQRICEMNSDKKSKNYEKHETEITKLQELIKDLYERQIKFVQEFTELKTKSEIAHGKVTEILKIAVVIAGIVSGLIGGLIIAFNHLVK